MMNIGVPGPVSRVIVHQFDPARPSPGGIDTCLRGICRYMPAGTSIAVIGVDTGVSVPGRKLGKWEQRTTENDEIYWFMPVARFDPADQVRRIPHVIRLMVGVVRYRRNVPKHDRIHIHRMDSALFLKPFFRTPQVYFIHTQDSGLVGQTSDSFWRFLGSAHKTLEQRVVSQAHSVVVFNEDYAKTVKTWNPRAVFSPTWYDPALIKPLSADRKQRSIIWVGRLEVPKDPVLAIQVFAALTADGNDEGWTLDVLGSGGLTADVERELDLIPPDVRSSVRLLGRVAPPEVARMMSEAGVFLMTSHPGYEGYARVLVEAMASGLPGVVTEGSDTGGIVVDGQTGYTCGRDPQDLADHVRLASALDRDAVVEKVSAFDAPSLVKRIVDVSA